MTGNTNHLNLVFSSLANPTRRAIVEEVTHGERTVLEIAKSHDMSLNAVSKHLKKLESAGLIHRHIDGSYHRISLKPEAMKEALLWMSQYVPFWSANLDGLKDYLEQK